MITRKEYMNNSNDLHRAYYAQMVTDQHKRSIIQLFGLDRLLTCTDPHLNDIPLRCWDNLANSIKVSNLKQYGENNSLSSKVCILKEAAKQIIEKHILANTMPPLESN